MEIRRHTSSLEEVNNKHSAIIIGRGDIDFDEVDARECSLDEHDSHDSVIKLICYCSDRRRDKLLVFLKRAFI